jgi:hypothetical protein
MIHIALLVMSILFFFASIDEVLACLAYNFPRYWCAGWALARLGNESASVNTFLVVWNLRLVYRVAWMENGF